MNMTNKAIHVYGCGVLAGIVALVWMQGRFVTSEKFEAEIVLQKAKWASHDSQRTETLDMLVHDIQRLNSDAAARSAAIMSRLERMENLIMNRRAEIQSPQQSVAGKVRQ